MLQWSPLWIVFKGKNTKWLISCQNDQRIERIIFCKLDHFWAALWTKKSLPSQNRVFENGVIVKMFKVIGPEEMLISIKGAAQAPPNWNEIDLKLINFNNHPISKIHKWLLLFLFLLLMLLLGIFGNIFLHLIDYQSLGTGSCIRPQENFKL